MSSIQIRKAVPGDLDNLLDFEQGIILAERPFDKTLKTGEIHYYDLAEYIRDKDTEVVVAESDGQLVGSGYARIMEAKPFVNYEKYAYLGFMYVAPEYRGKGINQAIIEKLCQWAQSRGITEIQLDVYSENAAAIKAYEKTGFEPYMLKMRKT